MIAERLIIHGYIIIMYLLYLLFILLTDSQLLPRITFTLNIKR